jgi:hypothetical protein
LSGNEEERGRWSGFSLFFISSRDGMGLTLLQSQSVILVYAFAYHG